MKHKKQNMQKEASKAMDNFISQRRDAKAYYQEYTQEWCQSALHDRSHDEYVLKKLVEDVKTKVHEEAMMDKAKKRKRRVSRDFYLIYWYLL